MNKLNKILDKYLENVADNIFKDAQQKCPVDTGTLKNSIKKDKTGNKEYTISANTNYAIFIELGTKKMQAQPFLKPALKNKNNYKKD